MARQYMPKIFHDPHKNPPPLPPPAYLMYGPLKSNLASKAINKIERKVSGKGAVTAG